MSDPASPEANHRIFKPSHFQILKSLHSQISYRVAATQPIQQSINRKSSIVNRQSSPPQADAKRIVNRQSKIENRQSTIENPPYH